MVVGLVVCLVVLASPIYLIQVVLVLAISVVMMVVRKVQTYPSATNVSPPSVVGMTTAFSLTCNIVDLLGNVGGIGASHFSQLPIQVSVIFQRLQFRLVLKAE